jgi:hypothetical protein
MAGFDERNTGNRRGGGILEEKRRSKCPESPVRTENLTPEVVVMETAEDGERF